MQHASMLIFAQMREFVSSFEKMSGCWSDGYTVRGGAILCSMMLDNGELALTRCCFCTPPPCGLAAAIEPLRSEHRQRAYTVRAVAALDATSGRRRKDVVVVPRRRLLLASSR